MQQLEKAFIIDDDPIHRFGMELLMGKVDFSKEILVFQDGQEAMESLLDLIGSGDILPSVIFLDLNMPVKDGWSFLDDFMKIPYHIREQIEVHIVSSSINPLDRERAKKCAAVSSYIVKPIDEGMLKQVLMEKIH